MSVNNRAQEWLRRLAVSLAVVVFTACLAHALDSSDLITGTHRLAYKFTAGEEIQHLLTMERETALTLPSRNGRKGKNTHSIINIKTWVLTKVLSVNDDGSAVVRKKLSTYQMERQSGGPNTKYVETANTNKVTVTFGGKIVPTEQMPGMISEPLHDLLFVEGVKMTVKPTGKATVPAGIASLSQSEKAVADSLLGDIIGVVFPDKPISVGESWSYKQPVNTSMGEFQMESKCKLLSIKTIGRGRYANIECRRTATMAGNSGKSSRPVATLSIKSKIAFEIEKGFIDDVEFEIVENVDGAGKGVSKKVTSRGKLQQRMF